MVPTTSTTTTASKSGRGTKTLATHRPTSAQVVNSHHQTTTEVTSNSKTSSSDDVLFDRKIEVASEGLTSHYLMCFYKIPLKENALTLASYIISMKSEINPLSYSISSTVFRER
jgi:hypothetical protein